MSATIRPWFGAAFALIAMSAGRGSDTSPLPLVAESEKYYRINGKSTQDLQQQMRELGPVDKSGRRCDAFTDWHVKWTYRYVRDATACRISSPEVSVTVEYTLPKWDRPPGVSEKLVSKWDAFSKALRRHEEGHKAIGVQAAVAIRQALEAFPPQASCEDVARLANSEGARLLDAARAQEVAYDERTNHGANEGAQLR